MQPAFVRRDPRAPHPRDVRVSEFAAWGPDCGDMFFFAEGAVNLLFSPADRGFSVKIKYMGFEVDGYCKRINACTRAGAAEGHAHGTCPPAGFPMRPVACLCVGSR